ncbi:MAG: ABC transporter substrate-binding protein [Clostridiales bacterium]|nr:ABC transporter substrate-binding protein [Clostridiales bacterium]
MKKVKNYLSVFLAVAMLATLLAGLAGCQKSKEAASPSPEEKGAAGAAISVTDSRGKTIELDKPAEKIVCLLNSGLNDLLMLGTGDTVVGIDEWTYTNEITYKILSKLDDRIANKEIPAVDSNMEKIISLEPDVVIIWANDTEKIETLENAGIKVVGIQVNDFDDVYTKLRTIAKLVGKEDRAEEIIDYTGNTLKSISDKTSTLSDDDKKTGIFVWGPSKLDLAGNTSTGHSMLELCGVTDCASDIAEEHFVAKMEDVIQWNPDAILMWNISDLNPEDYLGDSQWADVTAIKNKDVYEIPDDMTFYCDMWTVKYIYAAQYFAKSAYPNLFTDVDMDSFRDSMMTELYGKTVD